MALDQAALQALSNTIKNETASGANTATRIGTITESIIQNMGLSSDYRVVAGVIRNSGSGWEVIDDVDHTPLNIDSVSNDGSTITIDYTTLGASEVLSLVAAPDETYAGLYDFGSSVGTEVSSILIKKRQNKKIVSLITHTGNGNFTKSGSDVSAINYNTTTGLLTITHSTTNGVNPIIYNLPSAIGNDTLYVPAAFSLGGTTSTFRLYKADGSGQQNLTNPEMSRGYFTRDFETQDLTQTSVNPNNVTDASGNIWIIGIFKI